MTEYTVQVFNNSGDPKSYVVCMADPIVTALPHLVPVPIATPAWIPFNSIASGGWDKVVYTDSIYAFWGTSPIEPAPGVIITSGGTVPVDVTQRPTLPFSGSPPVGFGPVQSADSMPGSFAIDTHADFTADDKYLFGCAMVGTTSVPTPVAVFPAVPDARFIIRPVTDKLTVAEYQATTGHVIDIPRPPASATIDFSASGHTTAAVTQDEHGIFTVVYSD